MKRRLRVGVSACLSHPDPERKFFKGKTLVYAEESMFTWLMSEGVFPVLLPRPSGQLTVAALLHDIDALVLEGGADMWPGHYGEDPAHPEWNGDAERDRYELEMVHVAVAARKPILGICRGHQVLNVALGGTLWQDIATQHPGKRVHRNWDIYDQHGHEIRIEPRSWLGGWYGYGDGGGVARVNSVHHQGIKDLGRGLLVEARSEPDGVVEAFRLGVRDPKSGGLMNPEDLFVYGLQWHPEFMFASPRPGELDARVILQAFLAAADAQRRKVNP